MLPKFEYDALAPLMPVAATAMTPVQLAGNVVLASALLLPAATITTEPFVRALVMAV